MSDGGFDPDELIRRKNSEENLFGVIRDPKTRQYVSYPSVPKSEDVKKECQVSDKEPKSTIFPEKLRAPLKRKKKPVYSQNYPQKIKSQEVHKKPSENTAKTNEKIQTLPEFRDVSKESHINKKEPKGTIKSEKLRCSLKKEEKSIHFQNHSKTNESQGKNRKPLEKTLKYPLKNEKLQEMAAKTAVTRIQSNEYLCAVQSYFAKYKDPSRVYRFLLGKLRADKYKLPDEMLYQNVDMLETTSSCMRFCTGKECILVLCSNP
jgi:hypothetical protein